MPSKSHARGEPFEPDANGDRCYIKKVTIEEYRLVDHGQSSEVYSIDISEDGEFLIKTTTYRDGLLAFRSLQQLFYSHSEPDSDPYTPYAPIIIRDCPVFGDRVCT